MESRFNIRIEMFDPSHIASGADRGLGTGTALATMAAICRNVASVSCTPAAPTAS
jgi:hypothetical protein